MAELVACAQIAGVEIKRHVSMKWIRRNVDCPLRALAGIGSVQQRATHGIRLEARAVLRALDASVRVHRNPTFDARQLHPPLVGWLRRVPTDEVFAEHVFDAISGSMERKSSYGFAPSPGNVMRPVAMSLGTPPVPRSKEGQAQPFPQWRPRGPRLLRASKMATSRVTHQWHRQHR